MSYQQVDSIPAGQQRHDLRLKAPAAICTARQTGGAKATPPNVSDAQLQQHFDEFFLNGLVQPPPPECIATWIPNSNSTWDSDGCVLQRC